MGQVLAEMARRGISRDHILGTLRKLGADFPPASARLLRWAHSKGFDIRVLSDCNSVFISHVFHGERHVVGRKLRMEVMPKIGQLISFGSLSLLQATLLCGSYCSEEIEEQES